MGCTMLRGALLHGEPLCRVYAHLVSLSPTQFPGQLKMFMSAKEITRTRRPDDVSYMGHQQTSSEVWDRKRDEAEESGLARDIVQNGVQTPVELMKSTVVNGQHRVAVMMAHDPDELMPVIHHQTRKDSFSYHNDRAWPQR